MITITGGGFGLYGYLPAIIESNLDGVVLPEKYKNKIEERHELRIYSEKIRWIVEVQDVYAACDSIILSVPPVEQRLLIQKLLAPGANSITKFYLEKPLAINPADAKKIVRLLVEAGKQFVIGYTLLFCVWYEHLCEYIRNRENVEMKLHWNFKAFFIENDPNSWKAKESEGGGVLNFYGIHIVALLQDLGFSKVKQSLLTGCNKDRPLRWQASFKNEKGATFSVDINSNQPETVFRIRDISVNNGYSLLLKTPFDRERTIGEQDKRVDLMIKYLWSAQDAKDRIMFYERVNDLWQKVIDISRFEI